jgi:hypothetical protein
MIRSYKILSEIVIKDQVPMKMNGDTLAYKAEAFKTKPGASVEDLLKRLPGVQVDKNGVIRAQGEQVQKVYVDGKEFFSNDPKIATKNLSADMIDQVQLYNDQSEQAKFTGFDDGSRSKAINLKLKKEKKSGVFGKAYAGYGTDNKYSAATNMNYFKGASHFSFVGDANNISRMGISSSSGLMGSPRQGNTGGSGIPQSLSAGVNYKDTWSKWLDVSGSYFFDQIKATNFQRSFRQTWLGDSTLLTNRETIYTDGNNNHRLNLHMVFTIDSFNSIVLVPSRVTQSYQSVSHDSFSDYIRKVGVVDKVDDNHTTNHLNAQVSNWTNQLIWRRKFRRLGRTFSINVSQLLNKNERTGYSRISAQLYGTNGVVELLKNMDLKTLHKNNIDNRSAALAYTEPLGTKKMVELSYSYTKNRSGSDRKTFDYNNGTKQYDLWVDSLTNRFQTTTAYNRWGISLKGIHNVYNYQVGMVAQQVIMKSKDESKPMGLEQHYFNMLPSFSFNYRLSKNKNFQLSYRTQSNQPAISQLQNITDLSRYPYVRKGNPALRQEFVHNLMLTYTSFDATSFRNLFAYFTFSGIHNKIVTAIWRQAGEQTMMPVNANGAINTNGMVSLGWPIHKMEGGNLNWITQVDWSRNITLVNGVKNFTRDFSIGQEVSLYFTYANNWNIGFNANFQYNSLNYALEKEQSGSYFTHHYSIEASYTMANRFILSTNIDYVAYGGKSATLNQSYLLWNASISKLLFKNQRAELKFSVNDILNQNKNVVRTIAENFVEDIQSKVVKRFAMLTFIYHLNQMRKMSAQATQALSSQELILKQ